MERPILILSTRYNDDNNRIWGTALSNEWDVCRIQMASNIEFPIVNFDRRIAYFGNTMLGQEISNHYKISLLDPPLNWMETIPYEYSGRKIEFLKVSDFPYYETEKFVKATDNKWFSVRSFPAFDGPDFQDLNGDLLLSVQDVVEFIFEYRCFILDRKLMDMSIYPVDMFRLNPPVLDAEDFIEKILRDERIQIPRSVVIDIGLTIDDKWLIVEANPSFACGMYNCDPQAVFETIIEACIRDEDVKEEDKKWILRKGDYSG